MRAPRRAAGAPAPADRRTARATATRAAVVDAMLGLVEDGDLRPTAPRIAARAGVSLRSVFQHFADLDALFAAAADRQTARLRGLVHRLDPTAPLAARIEAFTVQRARLLEAIAPVRRAALMTEPFSAEVAKRLSGARTAGRREVAHLFARELAAHPPAARRELIAVLAAASSFPMWEALRAHEGLSAAQARRALARTLATLLRPA